MMTDSSSSSKFASLSSGLLARKGAARPAMRRPTAELPHGMQHGNHDEGVDLGWNDMGHEDAPPSAVSADKLLSKAIPVSGPEVKRQQAEIAAKLSLHVEGTEGPMDSTPAQQQPIAQPSFETLSKPVHVEPVHVEPVHIEPVLPEIHVPEQATEAILPQTAEAPVLNSDNVEKLVRPVLREMKIKARKRGRAKAKPSAAFTLRLDQDRHLRLRLACAVHDISAQKLITQALDALLNSMPEIEPLAERVNAK